MRRACFAIRSSASGAVAAGATLTIRVRRDEVERKDFGDTRQIRGIAGHECRANLTARPRNEDIEHEASTDVVKHEALAFDERRERRPQCVPGV